MDGAEYNIRQSDPAGRDSWPSGSTAGPVCSATVSIFKYFSLFSILEGEGGGSKYSDSSGDPGKSKWP